MEILGLAIFASTILFLIDKNHQWAMFWKLARRSSYVVLILGALSGAAFYIYSRIEAKRIEQKWSKYEVKQPELTPDQFMAQQGKKPK